MGCRVWRVGTPRSVRQHGRKASCAQQVGYGSNPLPKLLAPANHLSLT